MGAVTAPIAQSPRRVIIASSLGTVFEWYDFFLYGSLAAVISKQFFAGVSETTGFMFALLTWAAGFAVRRSVLSSSAALAIWSVASEPSS